MGEKIKAEEEKQKEQDKQKNQEKQTHNIITKAETFIDACYEMILKLNELKIL